MEDEGVGDSAEEDERGGGKLESGAPDFLRGRGRGRDSRRGLLISHARCTRPGAGVAELALPRTRWAVTAHSGEPSRPIRAALYVFVQK